MGSVRNLVNVHVSSAGEPGGRGFYTLLSL